jgi:hypothetical protein
VPFAGGMLVGFRSRRQQDQKHRHGITRLSAERQLPERSHDIQTILSNLFETIGFF